MSGTQTATVLVTDLVGSTELRTRLGEERADEFRRRHDGLLGAAVTDHGGSVIKGLGDGSIDLWKGPLNLQDGTPYLKAGEKATDNQIWFLPQLLQGMKGASKQ